MSGLTVDKSKCKGCGLCVKGCAAGALSLAEKLPQVDQDKCTLCGVCVSSCHFGALSIAKEQAGADVGQYRGLWVFVEQSNGQLLNVGLELLGKGRELADDLGCELTAVLCGHNISSHGATLVAAGADRVLLADSPLYAHNSEDSYSDLLARLIREEKPEIVLYGATGFGRSLAPRLAARLRTGLTADCTQLSIDKEQRLLQQTRPAFGGNLMATITCPGHRPQMATVRPGVMPALPPDPTRTGRIITVDNGDPTAAVVRLLRQTQVKNESIADAEIIVAAGRGLGQAKNLTYVKAVAEALGGVLGCTRPLVDAGWCEYKHQIGQTGCNVAPKLLISCGVSGAIQHLAGVANAQTIVAINTDADAPIFRVADYKIVGDCVEILKEMLAQLEASD